MTFPDYTRQVWEYYHQKRADPSFPIGLVRPTCANLKEACENACSERYLRQDERALKDFFGTGHDQASFSRVIRDTRPDKFKALYKYLRGEIRHTDERNIELLAWLIDFEGRPWYLGKEEQAKKPEIPVTQPRDKPAVKPMNEDLPVTGRTTVKFRLGRWYAFAAITLLAFLCYSIYWVWGSKPLKAVLTEHEACMYWAGDHYEPVSCSHPMGDTLVIALDSERLLHFKKIMNTDTITRNSIGVVWYVRGVNGEYEYYTTKGNHPLDPHLRLRPLTDYIIRHHLQPGQGTE